MKTSTAPLPPLRSVKVLDQLRERIRYLHYSLRTEQAYVHWVRAFIRFHGVRHPATLGSSEVEAFLSWLANERKVSVSTHRQALAALLFFYGKVLCTDLPWLQVIGRPRPSRRLPVVLTPDEVVRILGFLEGEHRLFAQLLYGTGMRISEGLQLRVKDLDFDHGTIIVREGKGSKDRALMLPESLAPSLREQLSRARAWWLKDQAEGRSGVALPDALERKYPRAGHSWPWFWVFAQHTHSTDPRSGVVRRHHMYDQTFQRAFKRAVESTSSDPSRPSCQPSPLSAESAATISGTHKHAAIYQGVRLGQSAIPFAWPEMPRANNVSGRYQMDFVGGGLHQTLQRSVVR